MTNINLRNSEEKTDPIFVATETKKQTAKENTPPSETAATPQMETAENLEAKSGPSEQKENFLKIHLKAAPEKGKANRELINFLANHFKVAKSQIEILKGLTSKNKMIRLIKNQ